MEITEASLYTDTLPIGHVFSRILTLPFHPSRASIDSTVTLPQVTWLVLLKDFGLFHIDRVAY